MKLAMAEMLEAIAAVEQPKMRLQPETRDDGVTFIRDDFKAPLNSLPPAFELMRNATAKRKIGIIGTISDRTRPAEPTYLDIALEAREIFDETIIIGAYARTALRANRGAENPTVKAFVSEDVPLPSCGCRQSLCAARIGGS